MKPTTVIGLGAGSHGRVIADIISRTETLTLHAWLDQSSQLHGTSVSNAKVMGDDSLLAELHLSGISKAFIGVGSIGDSSLRCHIVSQALEAGFFFPVITDPTALVPENSKIAEGTCIFTHVIVYAGCNIGPYAIINTRATVEHDCEIGEFCHLAPGSITGGHCTIGKGSHIGIGSVVKEGITIGENAIIGAGAVVISNVPDNTTVVGVPASPLIR